MNFQNAKDEVLKWLVPALLGGIFWQVNDLGKQMVEQKLRVEFLSYRADQQRDRISSFDTRLTDNSLTLSRLTENIMNLNKTQKQ